MLREISRRTLFLLLSFILSLFAIFLLLRVLPGDPSNALLSINATPDQIAAVRASVGADRPVWQQLISWLNDLVHLDFGTSYVSGLPVWPEISATLVVTIPLTIVAFILSVVIATISGALAAYYRNRWFGIALSALSQLGIAIPVFWIGTILVWIFALKYYWLPSGGFPVDNFTHPVDAIKSLILPVATIVFVMSASLTRYMKSVFTDVIDSDYIRTARSLGSSHLHAIFRHGARNASVPIISILGIELATTFLGAVVVESVFSLPGLGNFLVRAIAQHDYPNIQGVLLFTTLLVLLVGFAADILQRVIDPRIRSK